MTPGMQDSQDQRGEFVADGKACEMHARVLALSRDGERRRPALGVRFAGDADLVGKAGDFFQKVMNFLGLGFFAQRRDQFDGMPDLFEVRPDLVKHGWFEVIGFFFLGFLLLPQKKHDSPLFFVTQHFAAMLQ